jgi:hypothetical protein
MGHVERNPGPVCDREYQVDRGEYNPAYRAYEPELRAENRQRSKTLILQGRF